MRLLNPECAVPLLATGLAVGLTVGCSNSGSSSTTSHNQAPPVASPNFVPNLQALGSTFLRIYNSAPSYDQRSTPFESSGRITVAEVDVHVGAQVLKLTINQLPSSTINPSAITSLDILRFDQTKPLAGFDMTFERNESGTVDASCHAYQKPRGFSETAQNNIVDADGNPLPASSPEVADAFASDMFAAAAQQLAIATNNARQVTSPQYSTGDPCGVSFGGG